MANLTQSGVSQHIHKLENELGVSLFNRTQRRVELTEAGIQLHQYAEYYLEGVESLLESLSNKSQSLNGVVSYGMPASCLKTPHFPLLLEKRADFREVEIHVSLCPNEKVFEGLLEGRLDFGFVTKQSLGGGFEYLDFAEESYALVGTKDLIKNFDEETPFIDYPGMDVLLEYWRRVYFPRKRSLNTYNINKSGGINDLDGAIFMCEMGMGISVFPWHCVKDQLANKKLVAYKEKGKRDPIEKIYITFRKEKERPRRVEAVIQAFLSMQ